MPDNFATTIPDELELSRELGIDGELVAPSEEHRFAQVVVEGSYTDTDGLFLDATDSDLADRDLSYSELAGKASHLARVFLFLGVLATRTRACAILSCAD